jgi:hypothetical protein
MTISDEMLRLAEDELMSAGTRTKLASLTLRVQAMERELATLANVGGSALRQLHERVAGDPRETVVIRDPYRPRHTADVPPSLCRYCYAALDQTSHACHFDDGLL